MHMEISQIAVKIGCVFVGIRAAVGWRGVGVPQFPMAENRLSHPASDTDFGQVHFLKVRCRRSKRVQQVSMIQETCIRALGAWKNALPEAQPVGAKVRLIHSIRVRKTVKNRLPVCAHARATRRMRATTKPTHTLVWETSCAGVHSSAPGGRGIFPRLSTAQSAVPK